MKDDVDLYQTKHLEVGAVWHRENCEEKLIYLVHSCDKWVIGKPADAEQLIADLEHIIKNWKSYSITGLEFGEEE